MTVPARLLPHLPLQEEQRIITAIREIKDAGELQPVSKFPPVTRESVYDQALFGRPCVWHDPSLPDGLTLIHGERRFSLLSGTPVVNARTLPFESDRECRIFTSLVNAIEGRSDVYAIASLMLESGLTMQGLESLGPELSRGIWGALVSLERHEVHSIQ